MYTNAGLDRIIELLEADITYIGISTGAAPVSNDILLDTELERKAATPLVDGFTLILDAFWDESEANGFTYTGTGVFGDGASDTVNTGTLIAGGGINVPKDNTQSLTVSIEITVEAV